MELMFFSWNLYCNNKRKSIQLKNNVYQGFILIDVLCQNMNAL